MPPTTCEVAKSKGVAAPKNALEDLTVGMLTHEPITMAHTLATYEKYGFFDVIPEFIVYINKRTPAIDEALAPYVQRHPTVIKLLGDEKNYGILNGILAMTKNATKKVFILLERDFMLVEPDTCVVEQLVAGIKLLEAKKADVVRYRHRRRAGRPNWVSVCTVGLSPGPPPCAVPNRSSKGGEC